MRLAPTHQDIDRLVAAIWPWMADATPSVEAVRGKARRTPPLTHARRDPMAKVGSNLAGIAYDLERLSETALKGLAYALRRHGRLFEAERRLYEAWAEEAEHRRAIKARHRTGQGAWCASLEVMAGNEGHTVGESVEAIYDGSSRSQSRG